MLLRIPNRETLLTALRAGALPDTAAEAHIDEHGVFWLNLPGRTTNALVQQFAAAGLELLRGAKLPPGPTRNVARLAELIPLRCEEISPRMLRDRPVLFDLSDPQRLPALATEMLQLGSDRQSVRTLQQSGHDHALLRVVGPPYFTLLKVIEEARDDSLTAYVEQSPHVWVKAGFTHPLASLLRVEEGSDLFLRDPDRWHMLPGGPFRDLYDAVRFVVPGAAAGTVIDVEPQRFEVPIGLARDTGEEHAEMWILRHAAIDQLDELVADAGSDLLDRLSFAVTESDDERRVLLRARPGRGAPPSLAFDALALRPFLKIPHLFVPCGFRLQPPLRRDVVVRLLADDAEQVTWLEPADDGSFQTLRVADGAFRPLADWIDYILDQSRAPLEAWMQSFQFEFDDYVISDEATASDVLAIDAPRKETSRPVPESQVQEPVTHAVARVPEAVAARRDVQRVVPDPTPAIPTQALPQAGDATRQRLREIERAVAEIRAPLEDRDQLPLWSEMADLHAQIGQHAEALACRLHVWWETDFRPSQNADAWHEALAAVDWRLEGSTTMAIEEAVGNPARLQANEAVLPTRALWLAWLAITEQSGGDVLALARARDRILERLLRHGPSLRLDLPAFLHLSHHAPPDRTGHVQSRLQSLYDAAQGWVERECSEAGVIGPDAAAATIEYVDLIFAWGFARLGARQESRTLADDAHRRLHGRDAIHAWLADALAARIEAPSSSGDPLPAELLARLQGRFLTQLRVGAVAGTYLIDRFRRQSKILDPLDEVDAYRRTRRTDGSDITLGLERLGDLTDLAQLESRLGGYLAQADSATEPGARFQIARTALELAPRLGERFADGLLARAAALDADLPDPADRALLLEKSLHLAAHYGQLARVTALSQQLAARFRDLLALEWNPTHIERITRLLAQAFQGMRRLGLQEQILPLLEQLANLFQSSEEARPAAPRPARRGAAGREPTPVERRILTTTLMLPLASDWVSFGRAERAEAWIVEAERLLFSEPDSATTRPHPSFVLLLARTYAAAVSRSEPEQAVAHLERLFRDLHGVHVASQSDSHFSSSVLSLVEDVVVAIVRDDGSIDAATRQLLDATEQRLRQRIHRDLRQEMATS